MKTSVFLLVVAAVGVLGGAALIGRVAFGAAIMLISVAVAGWAVRRDFVAVEKPEQPPDVYDVLERARRAR